MDNSQRKKLAGSIALVLAAALLVSWWNGRRSPRLDEGQRPPEHSSAPQVEHTSNPQPTPNDICLVPSGPDGTYDHAKFLELMKGDPEVSVHQLLLISPAIIHGNPAWRYVSDKIQQAYHHIVFDKTGADARTRLQRGRKFLNETLQFLESLGISKTLDRSRFQELFGKDGKYLTVEPRFHPAVEDYRTLERNCKPFLERLRWSVKLADYLEDRTDLTERYMTLAKIAIEKFAYDPSITVFSDASENEKIMEGLAHWKKDLGL